MEQPDRAGDTGECPGARGKRNRGLRDFRRRGRALHARKPHLSDQQYRGSTADWELTSWPTFLNPNIVKGTVGPGATQFVVFTLDPGVTSMPGPLLDTQSVTFHQCLTANEYSADATLVIGVDTECTTAAPLDLAPDFPPTGQFPSANEERGVYITSMSDYLVCGVGITADLSPGTTVHCRIYEADGTTRGALLHSGSTMSYETGMTTHYVPFNLFLTQLSECQDYSIVFFLDTVGDLEYWDEGADPFPLDHAALIRTREGELNGDPSATERIHITLLGVEFPCEQLTDLAVPGETPAVLPTLLTDRGMFVTPLRTIRLCSILFNANVDPTATVTARVYEAVGTTRLGLLAEGRFPSAGSGMQQQGAPVNVVLLEGEHYNISLDYELPADIEVFDETAITLPYNIGDVMQVRDGEVGGNPAHDNYLPRFLIEWGEVGGGNYIGLSPASGAETEGTTDNDGRGVYLSALADQQVYAISWYADVPEGETISCGVFEAPGGVQGALISYGTIFSGGDGQRWHSVPVSAEFETGSEYNVVVSWTDVNEYTEWQNVTFPYSPNGLVEVTGGSTDGGAPHADVVHLSYRTCGGSGGTTTAIVDTPMRTPMYLRPPSPNPASGVATLGFQLESEGSVSLTVYDVKGRRVAEVVGTTLSAGPHERSFDTRGLPSGVYFVKLQTPTASVTRKLVVSR